MALDRFYSSAESADVAFVQLRSGLEEGYQKDNSKSLAAWNQGIGNLQDSLPPTLNFYDRVFATTDFTGDLLETSVNLVAGYL